MVELTSKQRSHLRALAHHLDPVVHVGREGVSEGVIAAVDEALAAHELIKVRLPGHRDERPGTAEEIAEAVDAAIAGMIGRIAILYRPGPDSDQREIELPE
ncbi:MAG: ribosome assembly RNA-binding protein YhbY [Gemmatimonadota bacterium]|nr:ribosome assembly RNA-binding protein YhbY [Gemmatimonadota bacterium]